MDKRIKGLWLKALRSGEYKQGREYLNNNGFCCLGVLCDLYAKETDHGRWIEDPILHCGPSFKSLNGESDEMPPLDVLVWAGLVDVAGSPNLYFETIEGMRPSDMFIPALNDNGWSFKQLADQIARDL
jgi:hypothetical protein